MISQPLGRQADVAAGRPRARSAAQSWPEGLDLLAQLTEQSDVVLTNALPEASARLGIDYATVAARDPSVCHISVLGSGRKRLPPRHDGDERPPIAGAAATGLDNAEVLRRYGLADQHEALLASGAMRRKPGPITRQASSV